VLQFLASFLNSLLEFFSSSILVVVSKRLSSGDCNGVPLNRGTFSVLIGDRVVDVVAGHVQVGGGEGLEVGLHESFATANQINVFGTAIQKF
jgi:hypothetical protein